MACETIRTFLRLFCVFFFKIQKHDFLRFLELLHTFSRTLNYTIVSVCYVTTQVTPTAQTVNPFRCNHNTQDINENFNRYQLSHPRVSLLNEKSDSLKIGK